MKPILQATSLTKDFGDKKGVFGLDLALQPGEIVGFVGPNGAGKSTTISMLCGNIYPDKGNLQLFGKPVSPVTIYEVMPKIGVLLSESAIEEQITPKQLFLESEQLLGQTTQWSELCQYLALDSNQRISKLSLGNKKKVGMILALMHQPEVVIMDEPTSGIDPIIVNKFSKLMKDVSARSGAVLLSSHDLHEIQDVCDRVIMIKDGKILIDRPIQLLLKDAKRKFSINNPTKEVHSQLFKLYSPDVIETSSGLTLQTQDYKKVIELLAKNGCYDFLVESPSLEEMFAEYYL